MKINKKKLGFTLVELLVVIAILAVLATVAIIGYSSFINEAHKSNDNSVVTELNHYLKAANPLDEKVPTATDAAEKLEGCGLNIAELQPSAKDAYYGYNYKTKEFVYVEAPLPNTPDAANITTFLFVKNDDQIDDAYGAGYSVYLQKGYTKDGTFEAHYGLDVGEATVNNISYTSNSSQEVVIRTNGGTLTVNAEYDTVNHYGDGLVLNIENIDTQNCYREFGTFANAQIKRGKVVIENSEANINNLLLVAKSDKSGFEDIIVETKTGAEMPTFDRTDVNIAATGTLVLNVVTPTTDEYVYLTKAGVVEQIVVTTTETADVSGQTGNVASKSTKTQAVAEQVANVGTKDVDGNYVDADGNPVELDALNSVDDIVVESRGDSESAATGLTKFAGGAGTKTSPYLISCQEHFNNIAIFNNEMYNCSEYYFAQIADITLDGSIENQPNEFTGNFVGEYNGNGYSIYMVNTADAATAHRATLFGQLDGTRTKIHDFTLYVEEYDTNIFSINRGNNTVIENITIENNKNYTVTKGIYYNYGLVCVHNRGSIAFKNITNNANVDFGNWYSAVIMGGYSNKNTGMIFDNCVNNGYISGSDVGFLIGNYTYNNSMVFEDNQDSMNTLDSNKVKIYINDCKNNNVIFGTSGADIICQTNGNNNNNLSSDSLEYVYSNCLKGTIVNGSQIPIALGVSNNNIYISTTVSNASYYIISAKTAVSYKEGGSGWVTINYDNITESDNIIFIKYFMSEDMYEAEYGKTYDSLTSEENCDSNLNRYKIVEENGINIVVVKTLDSNKGISSFKHEVTYDVFAYDDTNKLITGNTFKASDLC